MNINRCRLMTAFTMAMLSTLVILFGGGAARGQHIPLDRTLTTDQVTIKQGQTARLEVANKGDQSLIVWLFFRDSEGKVLMQKQVAIKSGATAALEYSITGTNNPLGIAAQFGTKEAMSVGLPQPVPMLRIVDKRTGDTIRIIGPERFKESRNPKGLGGDQTEFTELRPGNDSAPPKGPADQTIPIAGLRCGSAV